MSLKQAWVTQGDLVSKKSNKVKGRIKLLSDWAWQLLWFIRKPAIYINGIKENKVARRKI